MSTKRFAAAAAVAAILSASATVFSAGFASSDPCPSWNKNCGGGGNTTNPNPPGYGGTGQVPPPGSNVPGHSTAAPSTPYAPPKQTTAAPPPSTTWTQPKQTTAAPPPSTTWTQPKQTTPGPTSPASGPTTSLPVQCPSWYPNCTTTTNPGPAPHPTTVGSPHPTTGQWGPGGSPSASPGYGGTPQPTTTVRWGGTTPKPGPSGSYTTPVLNAPVTQPQHPPYYPPRGPILRGTPQYGGPVDLQSGYYLPGQGAPPAPPQRGYGWNDGQAPGYAPPNWEGPPPSGGWNGPPPAGGWNRPWVGTPVDMSYGQSYFAPFTYNNYIAIPMFNCAYGGWGYWFDGIWAPLY
jgi:hypothetical protein